MIVSPDTRVLFERAKDETDPETLARTYMRDVDLVIVEGFKRAPLPKVEVYRKGIGVPPIYDAKRRRMPRIGSRSSPTTPRFVPIAGSFASWTRCGCPCWRASRGSAPRCWSHRPAPGREAARAILAEVPAQPSLRVPLDDALGSVLAESVTSPLDIPPWTNSAMDGYAARADDVRGASRRRSPANCGSSRPSPPGSFPTRAIGPGNCARIFTGAPLPEGADSVIRQEDTEAAGETGAHPVRSRCLRATSGARARMSGEDSVVLERGDRSSAPRPSACSRPSRSPIRWSIAGPGSGFSAAATKSWTWIGPTRSGPGGRSRAPIPTP